MQLTPSAGWKTATVAIRMALGAVFLISCIDKIAAPRVFAEMVANYQILPPPLVTATAVVLPWIEALCGLALVLGRFDHGAALLVCLMMTVFIGVTAYNQYRGLNIACGCFSLAAAEPSNIILVILRDLAILAAGVWVLLCPARPQMAA